MSIRANTITEELNDIVRPSGAQIISVEELPDGRFIVTGSTHTGNQYKAIIPAFRGAFLRFWMFLDRTVSELTGREYCSFFESYTRGQLQNEVAQAAHARGFNP